MEETKSDLAPLTLCSAFNKTAIEERIAAIRHIKKATCASLIASSLLIVGVPAAFASTTYWILPNGAEAYSYSYGSADVAASTDGDETASTPQAIDGEGRPRGSADGAAIASGLDDGAVASAAGPGDIASAVENGLITSVAVSDDMVTTLADADAGSAAGTTEDDAVAYLNSLKPLGLTWEFETTTETMENGDGGVETNLVMAYDGKTVHAVYDRERGMYIASGETDLMHGEGSDAIDLEVTYDGTSASSGSASAEMAQPEGLTPVEGLHNELDHDADGLLINAYCVFTPQKMGDVAVEGGARVAETPESAESFQSSGGEETGYQELASKFAPFEKFGLSYDVKTGVLTYTDPTGKNAKAPACEQVCRRC